MSNAAESVALSPFMFGAVFLEGALSMQRRIAEGMLAVFDAATDAMRDSLRAGAVLADDIGRAETPVAVAAASLAWMQGRMEQGLSRFRVTIERIAARSAAPAAQPPTVPAPAALRRAPVVPQDVRIPTKPPAGKLRRGEHILVNNKAARKPARPAAK